MWKKEEAPSRTPEPEPKPRAERPASPSGAPAQRATIGRSITIQGEVTGDEDLLIQGTVDGSVKLKQHSVTVGPEGEVKADVIGRVVTVEGSVEGNLTADEQVILRSSARVSGDITAPRVVLEDGARFRGGVDMGDSGRSGRSSGTSVTQTSRPSERADGSQEKAKDTSAEKSKEKTDTAKADTAQARS